MTYRIIWKKGDKKGDFIVNANTDDECIKIGHEEVEKTGAEVIDYYMI